MHSSDDSEWRSIFVCQYFFFFFLTIISIFEDGFLIKFSVTFFYTHFLFNYVETIDIAN